MRFMAMVTLAPNLNTSFTTLALGDFVEQQTATSTSHEQAGGRHGLGVLWLTMHDICYP